MALFSLVKTLAFAASFLRVAALGLGLDPDPNGGDDEARPPHPVTTITIPYLGDHTTSTIITHCGTTTVVVETPLVTTTCSSTTRTTSTAPPTTSSTRQPTTSSTKEPTTSSTKEPTTSSTTTSSTRRPTTSTTKEPTTSSTKEPTTSSTREPTTSSTKEPTTSSTREPTTSSTTTSSTRRPTTSSTKEPTSSSTREPTTSSTRQPTTSSTREPTSSSTTTSSTRRPTSSSTKEPTSSYTDTSSSTWEPTSSSTTRSSSTRFTSTTWSTSKTTSSTTTTHAPTPTPGGPCSDIRPYCPARGLEIDYYPNPFTGYSRQGGLPWSYYITQNLQPLASSLTNVAFFPQDTGPPPFLPKVYPSAQFPSAWYAVGWTKATNGGIRVDANNFTLVYTGFYRAAETGRHTLCTTADNENDVFFGHGNAFSCRDGKTDPRVAPLVVSTGGNYINGIKCATVDLVKNAYYPVRSVMGNWQGPSAFNLTIQKPSETFEQRRNDFSGLAYPRSCGRFW